MTAGASGGASACWKARNPQAIGLCMAVAPAVGAAGGAALVYFGGESLAVPMGALEKSVASEVRRQGGTEIEVEWALQGLKIASVGAGALGARAATKPSLSLARPRSAPAPAPSTSGASSMARPQTGAGSRGVWSQEPFRRGVEVENRLARTEYSVEGGWHNVGAERGGKYPLVDFHKDGTNVLLSLKTVDTQTTGWMTRMQRHIEDLSKRGAHVEGRPAQMRLDIRVPPGGKEVAKPLIKHGLRQENTVHVIIKELS